MKLPDRLAGIPVVTELPEFLPGKIPSYPEGDDSRDSKYPHRDSRARDRRVMRRNQAASGLQQVHLSPLTHRWVQMAQNIMPSLLK